MGRSLSWNSLLNRFSLQQFVVGGLVAATILIISGWWLMRKHEESSMREVLQEEATIVGPPIEIQLPARVSDTAETRSVLATGVSSGLWVIQKSRRGQSEVLQLFLTAKGQKYFSSV